MCKEKDAGNGKDSAVDLVFETKWQEDEESVEIMGLKEQGTGEMD